MVVNWLDIHQSISNMIRAVFESAVMVHPEMHSPSSRAIYGIDVMLDSCFQPKLLEVCFEESLLFFFISLPKKGNKIPGSTLWVFICLSCSFLQFIWLSLSQCCDGSGLSERSLTSLPVKRAPISFLIIGNICLSFPPGFVQFRAFYCGTCTKLRVLPCSWCLSTFHGSKIASF